MIMTFYYRPPPPPHVTLAPFIGATNAFIDFNQQNTGPGPINILQRKFYATLMF